MITAVPAVVLNLHLKRDRGTYYLMCHNAATNSATSIKEQFPTVGLLINSALNEADILNCNVQLNIHKI